MMRSIWAANASKASAFLIDVSMAIVDAAERRYHVAQAPLSDVALTPARPSDYAGCPNRAGSIRDAARLVKRAADGSSIADCRRGRDIQRPPPMTGSRLSTAIAAADSGTHMVIAVL